MKITNETKDYLLSTIRDIKDFPKPGIVFKDITTLLNNKKALSVLMNILYDRYKDKSIDYIVGAESRGFIFGAPLAVMLGCGFVPIRKPGKLPYTTISEKYSLEYGFDEVELHIDAFDKNSTKNIIFIDDLIATGGTAEASIKLIKQAGGNIVESCFIIELAFLKGRDKIIQHSNIFSVLEI